MIVARPLVFEANRGQTDDGVRFLARGAGGTAFLTPTETVLPVRGGALRIRPADANPAAAMEGEDELPGKANYLLGNDPSKWRSNVPTFARVRSRDVYPGIDVVFHRGGAGLEYDFVVAPGADPSPIAVEFDGACSLALDAAGDLRIGVAGETVIQRRPVVYQPGPDGPRTVDGRYVVESARRVSFAVGTYDHALPLVLDPAVEYATYLGGSALESPRGAVRDAQGNAYIVGATTSTDFPKAAAYDSTYGGAGQFSEGDGFISKLDPTGTTLLFSTYVGGNLDDVLTGVSLDGSGNVWVCGATRSGDFPTTPGVIEPAAKGAADAVICEFSGNGASLLASTYLGGAGQDEAEDVQVDAAGNVYVVGSVSADLVTTAGVVQPSRAADGGLSDVYVAKLAPDLKSRVFVTLLGGNGQDAALHVALAPGGDVLVSGHTASTDFPHVNAAQATYGGGIFDGFLTRLNANATAIVFSTYIGGPQLDVAVGLAVDDSGNATVAGYAGKGLLGIANAFQPAFGGGSNDGFVGRYAADGTKLSLSYLGGSGDDQAGPLVRDAAGLLWVAGTTKSDDLHVVGAEQSQLAGGNDCFVARLDATASAIQYASYLGGTGDDFEASLFVSLSGRPYLVVITRSLNVPTSAGSVQPRDAGGDEGFVGTLVPPTTVESYFLPKTIRATAKANLSKSTLTANGVFDSGPGAPNFAAAATLDAGGLHFAIPGGLTPAGKAFTFAGGGVVFSITPNTYGSSRAQFKFAFTGDLTGKVDLGGPLTLEFANTVADGLGIVQLAGGKFDLGKVKGALIAPDLFVTKARATFKGAGKDTLSLTVGLAGDGRAPPAASDLTIGFGDGVAATIPAASFKRKGKTDVFTGNVDGITKVTVDHANDRITISGKGLDLGAYAPGGNPVLVSMTIAAVHHTVRVRLGRTGNVMKY